MFLLAPFLAAVIQSADDELKPTIEIDVWGKITAFQRHPTRDTIYALDASGHRVLELEAGREGIARELDVRDGAESMAITPDGARLLVTVSTGGHKANIETESGLLQTIDLERWAVARTVELPFDPFSIAIEGGRAYVSGGSNSWTRIAAIDLETDAVVEWLEPKLVRGAYLAVARGRFYSNTRHSSPQRIQVWTPGGDPAHRTYRGRVSLGRADEFFITPDASFLIARSGIVLELSDDEAKDLTPRFGLKREILGFAQPPNGEVAYLSDARNLLHEYDAKTFRFRRSFFLDTKAYRLLADRSGRYLYAAVYPGEFTADEAGGPGDIFVYDLTRLPDLPPADRDVEPVKLDVLPSGVGDARLVASSHRVEGEPEACGRCEGKKTVSWATVEEGVRTEFTGECPACFGAGTLETLQCPTCGGYGKEYVHSTVVVRGSAVFVSEWVRCGMCEGRKWIPLTPYMRAAGEGAAEVECLRCHATGTQKTNYSVDGREGVLEEACGVCKGSKKLALADCGDCHGTGVVVSDTTLTVDGTPVQVSSIGRCKTCGASGVVATPVR